MDLKFLLADFLRSREMSASELARRAGISKQTISDWLQGLTPRNLEALRRVAQVFGVTIDELLFMDAQGGAPKRRAEALIPEASGLDRVGMALQEIAAVTDTLGRVQTVSSGWADCMGWTGEELTGHSFFGLIHWEDVGRWLFGPSVWRHREIQLRHLNREGRAVWISWSVLNYKSDGLLMGVGDLVTDVESHQVEGVDSFDVAAIAGTIVKNCRAHPATGMQIHEHFPGQLMCRGRKIATAQVISAVVWELILLARDLSHAAVFEGAPRLVLDLGSARHPVLTARLSFGDGRDARMEPTDLSPFLRRLATLAKVRLELACGESNMVYRVVL